ncbi:SIS domain-containing protein [Mycolicibacterium obuense]|uniref:Glutamine--fructose-6-phosphate aminotransferase [isomerizing] n=1 Tax=Mycolicibacterium obuense TaxID=1807 RepID=A0A0J6VR66_9MYCO|nr:SIS domain-containing protein [Mycolicibacterium obuense]KMO73530.1 glucosamine--fructose-6-phosphate aminotransferase [Mycolicibacterium obuense]
MKPDAFMTDLTRKPEVLARLALMLAEGNPWARVVPADTERVVFIGMGSSNYAGAVAAARLRARGIIAVAELASSALLPDWGPRTLVVATSASGGSTETLDALTRLPEGAATVALTNTPGSPLTERCDAVVTLEADVEHGGVACRSYQHTLAVLLALECHLLGTDTTALAATIDSAAAASTYLLDSESSWLPEVSELLLGPSGTHLAAPVHRLCSAQQGALMLREGPRLPAAACETGDWSHVDVYLTKTTDYRLLVFAGSPWEAQLAEWTTARGSTVVGVGGDVPGARYVLRYPGDSDDDVALLTEVLVPEMVAGRRWQQITQETIG